MAAAPDLVLLDATRAPASPALIQNHADLARQETPHVLIVVDSLHSWAARALPGLNEYDALNNGLAALQTIAANLNCPILVIAERSRSAMKEGGQSAGAGSRKIEVRRGKRDRDAPRARDLGRRERGNACSVFAFKEPQ